MTDVISKTNAKDILNFAFLRLKFFLSSYKLTQILIVILVIVEMSVNQLNASVS